MPEQDLSRLGLRNGFRAGENGWGEEAFNYNFNKLSSLIHISIKAMNKRVPSSNDPVGTAYIVGSSPYGHFSGISAGWIAYKDLSSPAPTSGTSPAIWYFQQPFTGMTIYNETDNRLYVYDNGWAIVRPPLIGGRWYKTGAQLVGATTGNSDSRIAWGGLGFQLGVQMNSNNTLSFTEAGYYDIRLQTTCQRGFGGGHSFTRIRNNRTGAVLAEASIYAPASLSVNEVNICSWQGLINVSDTIDFRIQTSESANTVQAGQTLTFCDCKRID